MTRPTEIPAWKVRIWLRSAGVIHTLSTHKPEPDDNGGWRLTFPKGLEHDGDQIGELDWSEVMAVTWRPPCEPNR